MESIPPWFWMLVITFLTGGLFAILVYIALVIRESISVVRESAGVLVELRSLMKESQGVIAELQGIMGDAQKIVSKVNGVVETVDKQIIKPIASIGGFLKSVKSFIPGNSGDN